MTVYYAVWCSSGPAFFFCPESVKQFLGDDKEGRCQPFNTIFETERWVQSHSDIPSGPPKNDIVLDLDTNSESSDGGAFVNKKRKLGYTSLGQNDKWDANWEAKFQKLKEFTEGVADGDPNLVLGKRLQTRGSS